MEKWSETIAVIVPGIVALATLLIGNHLVLRRWKAERDDKLWGEALALARVVESDKEAELTKAIARTRLESLGITEGWLQAETHKRAGHFSVALPEASLIKADTDVVRQALDQELPQDPDTQRVIDAVQRVENAFKSSHDGGNFPQDTIRFRVFMVLVAVGTLFTFLLGTAIVRAVL